MSGIYLMRTVAMMASLIPGSAALAVGDPPRQLDRHQAAAAYATVRSLLVNDGQGCPAGGVLLSGAVTGGSSPGGGSQTTVVRFSRGAAVTIVREWSGGPSPSSSVQVTCVAEAKTVSLDVTRTPVARRSASERCRELETSLRVAAAGSCDGMTD